MKMGGLPDVKINPTAKEYNDALLEIERLKRMLQATQQLSWVSVKDRPEIGKWVLLFNGNWIGVGKYQPDDDDEFPAPAWQDETGEYIIPEPTHWMEKPEPPKIQTR